MDTEITPENYEENRKKLVELNSNLLGVVMNEKEIKLDGYFSKLKNEYHQNNTDSSIYQIPVLTDKGIRESGLYGFCSKLPKGADLHVHDMSLLPAGELIKVLIKYDGFCINADRRSFDLITVDPKDKIPNGYIDFRYAMESGYYTEDDLVMNWTVAGAENSDVGIWEYFEELFNKHAVLSGNIPFADLYYHHAFRYYCECGIMHVEVHIILTESIDESAEYIKVMRQAYYDVKKEYPFFTVRIIGAGVKADNDNIELTKNAF